MNEDMPWVNLTQEEVEELRKQKHKLTNYGREQLKKLKEKQETKMTELTKEQRQTIEDALNSLPQPVRKGMYATMEGIEEQLARGDKIIFYMSALENEPNGFSMHKMKVGDE